ncbi:type II toxin-antitoxin system PemK/MazF family toxin [Actinospica sp. MGRD01-02]|uniref:Type II toxin-antitoxin system PemK/MazF family toxin n=1 Tax=Actinospica acidithermotolerans TaxID=2828514 RepID=A0A941ILN6_9ACTN|nr:type II toxin-antitoxin system PemK/MazF family toxin [Actinospica acidithermotolerans]
MLTQHSVGRPQPSVSVVRKRGAITVAPITSNTICVLSFQVLVPAGETSGLKSDSKIQAEQIRSVSFDMIGNRIGHLEAPAWRGRPDPDGLSCRRSSRRRR